MTTKEMTAQVTMEMTNVTVQEPATMEMIGKKRNKNAKPVLCITEGKTFASTMDAAQYYGVHHTAISAVCRGDWKTCKGMKFCYIDKVKENLPVIAEEIQVKAKHSGGRKPRQIKCIETGVEYPSITECTKEIGVSTTRLYYHLQGKTENINGNHYVLMDTECAECVREMTEIVDKASTYDSLIEKVKLLEESRLACQSYRTQYKENAIKLMDSNMETTEFIEAQQKLGDELLAKSKLVQELETEIKNMLNL